MKDNYIFVTERLAEMLSELGFGRVSEEMEEQVNHHTPVHLFGFYISTEDLKSFITLTQGDRYSNGMDLVLNHQIQQVAIV